MGDPMKLRRISISSLQGGHVGAVVRLSTDVGTRRPKTVQRRVENVNDNDVATRHTSCCDVSHECTVYVRNVPRVI